MNKDNYHSHIFSTGRKYCSNHMATAPIEGGKDVYSKNGLVKRWICASCLTAKAERRMQKEMAA